MLQNYLIILHVETNVFISRKDLCFAIIPATKNHVPGKGEKRPEPLQNARVQTFYMLCFDGPAQFGRTGTAIDMTFFG